MISEIETERQGGHTLKQTLNRSLITKRVLIPFVVLQILLVWLFWPSLDEGGIVQNSPRRTNFEPRCNSTAATFGAFQEQMYVFKGPCSKIGISKWYSRREQVCQFFQEFDVYLVGQSTERRLAYTLQTMSQGLPEAFKNQFEAETYKTNQTLPDMRGRFKGLVTNGTGQLCFSVEASYERFWDGTFRSVNKFIEKALARPERKAVIIVQAGVYQLAGHLLSLEPTEHMRRLETLFMKSIKRLKDNSNVKFMWKPPVPVNSKHRRFVQNANEILAKWRDLSNHLARESGVCIFDGYDPIMDGIEKGLIAHETGKEWKPRQIGGIHLRDNGRKLMAQLMLNAVTTCFGTLDGTFVSPMS